ncbi:MAG: ATP-binding protein [Actinomycetota bacterium]|nr:ATP-binding protein [Actinomycetota bacterium]
MKRRLLITHIATALILLALARLAPGLNLLVIVALALLTAWIIAGSAWDYVRGSLIELAGWIRNDDREQPPPAVSDDFADIIKAISSVRDRFRSGLAELVADTHRAGLILNNMRDGVILADPEGLVILANPAAGAIFRRPVEEFIGRPLVYAIHSHELDKLMNDVIAGGQEAEAEIDVLLPRQRRLRTVALPVVDENKLSAVLLVFQDITGRYRVDAVRRAFVANVSHELKTPVAGVNLLADSLLACVGVDDEAAKRFAAKLSGEAKLLSQLISDLLDLSQLEAPEVGAIFTPVAVSSVAKKVVIGFTEIAAAKGLSLRTELARGLPRISGNEDQIRLMLRNLIENAVHYTPTGGDILVKTVSANGGVALEVIDTGIGIPVADLGRVFERFYRVDKARSRETGGTGLGLSIVKHVVENHDGEIKISSTVGVGSTFTVYLPAKVKSTFASEIRQPKSIS